MNEKLLFGLTVVPEARVERAQVRHRLGAQLVAFRRTPRRHARARQRGVESRGRKVVRAGGAGEAEAPEAREAREAREAPEGLRRDGVHFGIAYTSTSVQYCAEP